jgi:hypothetical protein
MVNDQPIYKYSQHIKLICKATQNKMPVCQVEVAGLKNLIILNSHLDLPLVDSSFIYQWGRTKSKKDVIALA